LRGQAVLRIERGKLVVERGQGVISETVDHAKGVSAWDPALRAHVAEKPVSSLIKTTHLSSIQGDIESDAPRVNADLNP
jgi:hypothetical protein